MKEDFDNVTEQEPRKTDGLILYVSITTGSQSSRVISLKIEETETLLVVASVATVCIPEKEDVRSALFKKDFRHKSEKYFC